MKKEVVITGTIVARFIAGVCIGVGVPAYLLLLLKGQNTMLNLGMLVTSVLSSMLILLATSKKDEK